MANLQHNRKKTRKFLFQKLYSSCFSKIDEPIFMDSFYTGVLEFDLDKDYLEEMENHIHKYESNMLDIIKKYAPKFDFKNMNIVYVLPIYIGLAEMLYLKEEIPAKVSMNECIEVSKAFGDESAKKIVNGVINKAYQNLDEIKKISKEPAQTDFSFFQK